MDLVLVYLFVVFMLLCNINNNNNNIGFVNSAGAPSNSSSVSHSHSKTHSESHSKTYSESHSKTYSESHSHSHSHSHSKSKSITHQSHSHSKSHSKSHSPSDNLRQAIYTSDSFQIFVWFTHTTSAYTAGDFMTATEINNLVTVDNSGYATTNVQNGTWLTNTNLLINLVEGAPTPVATHLTLVSSSKFVVIQAPYSPNAVVSADGSYISFVAAAPCGDLGITFPATTNPLVHVRNIFQHEIVVPCANLFSPTMIPTFGTNAVCSYFDYDTIRVYFGAGFKLFSHYYPTFTPGNGIIFAKTTAIYASGMGCPLGGTSLFGAQISVLTFAAGGSVTTPSPQAIIAGPQHAFNLCGAQDEIAKANVFDACLSVAGYVADAGTAPLTYSFTVTNTSQGNVFFFLPPSQTCILDSLFLASVAAGSTSPEGIDIAVTVTNLFGKSNTANLHVNNVLWGCNPAQPIFYIDRGNAVTINADETLTLRAVVSFAYPSATTAFTGLWTMVFPQPNPKLVSPQSYITIPPFTFVPGQIFTLRYEMFLNSTATGFFSIGYEDVNITVLPIPIKVVIDGGNRYLNDALPAQYNVLSVARAINFNFVSIGFGQTFGPVVWQCYNAANPRAPVLYPYAVFTNFNSPTNFTLATVSVSNLTAGNTYVVLATVATSISFYTTASTLLFTSATVAHVVSLNEMANPLTGYLYPASSITLNSMLTSVVMVDALGVLPTSLLGLATTWTIYGPDNSIVQTLTSYQQGGVVQYVPTVPGWYTFVFTYAPAAGVPVTGFQRIWVNYPPLVFGTLSFDNINWLSYDILNHARFRVLGNSNAAWYRYTFYINDIAVSIPGAVTNWFNFPQVYFNISQPSTIQSFGVLICDPYAKGCNYQSIPYNSTQFGQPPVTGPELWNASSRYAALTQTMDIALYTHNWGGAQFIAWSLAQTTQVTLTDLTSIYFLSLAESSGLEKALCVREVNALLSHLGYVFSTSGFDKRTVSFIKSQNPPTFNTAPYWLNLEGITEVIGFLAEYVTRAFSSNENIALASGDGNAAANAIVSTIDGLVSIGWQLRLLNAKSVGDTAALSLSLAFFAGMEQIVAGLSTIFVLSLPCSQLTNRGIQVYSINPVGSSTMITGEYAHLLTINPAAPYTFPVGGYNVTFPAGYLGVHLLPLNSFCLAVHKAVWKNNLYVTGTSTSKAATPTLSVSVKDINGTVLEVNNTDVSIQLNVYNYLAYSRLTNATCAYFDQVNGIWSTDLYCGSELPTPFSYNYNNNIVTCKTCHLSEFSVVEYAMTVPAPVSSVPIVACSFTEVVSQGTFNLCLDYVGSAFSADNILAAGNCQSYHGTAMTVPCDVPCIGTCTIGAGTSEEVVSYFIEGEVDCTLSTCPIGCAGQNGVWAVCGGSATASQSHKKTASNNGALSAQDKTGNALIGVGAAILGLVLLFGIAFLVRPPPPPKDPEGV